MPGFAVAGILPERETGELKWEFPKVAAGLGLG